MSYEKEKYEIKEIWESEWFSELDKMRFEILTSIVEKLTPKKLVDIGCGNGLYLNQLRNLSSIKFDRLCGVDRSSTAIKHVKTESVLASVDNLPFIDNEFEMATCLEVIEHLPVGIFQKSLSELSRISSRYILISVPYKDNLKKSLIECPQCYTKFNPYYHVHSFDEMKMKDLFKSRGFKIFKIGFIGEKETLAFPELVSLLLIGKKNRVFPAYTICPVCGYNENSKLKVVSTKNEINQDEKIKIHGIKSGVKQLWPKTKTKKWIYGVYEKV